MIKGMFIFDFTQFALGYRVGIRQQTDQPKCDEKPRFYLRSPFRESAASWHFKYSELDLDVPGIIQISTCPVPMDAADLELIL